MLFLDPYYTKCESGDESGDGKYACLGPLKTSRINWQEKIGKKKFLSSGNRKETLEITYLLANHCHFDTFRAVQASFRIWG